MGYWIKHFKDGSTEKGTDIAIKSKIASWSKGKLNDMSGVELSHAQYKIEIHGDGEFHQSDVFEVVYPNFVPTLLKRRLFRKITSEDSFVKIQKTSNSLCVKFNEKKINNGKYTTIHKPWIGKWMVVEIDISTGNIRNYLKDKAS
jgi:hypothetical protein